MIRRLETLRGMGAVAVVSFMLACAGAPEDAEGGPSGEEQPVSGATQTPAGGETANPEGAGEAMAGACVPVEHSLEETSTLATMAGAYQLVLVAEGEDAASAEGALMLEAPPAGLLEMGGASTPLVGTTDVDVEAVGALRMGDLDATDPAAPGVLVIETSGTNILLRLGSASNRRDQASFDAGYTVLRLTRIANGGFDGSWRSGSRDGTTRGFFCARPAGA